MTTHLKLVPRSRKRGSIHPLTKRLPGVVLDWLGTGTTLPFLSVSGLGHLESRAARALVNYIRTTSKTFSQLKVRP
jgi:hypothetical protein